MCLAGPVPKLKPAFIALIKATLEKLSIDYKGPLPSVTHNIYLWIVDEY